ncbi:hypothetical protein [Pontiella agarivorans]|uniref:Uncharacterized protein n=1 Tax=Pontiella agarivorans TaxID=3038953 RepID=A0ABU5MVE6_9BACT|nr:hypothetical protein [Pontiella agarivorans]MDZ8118204.1 hypothetical protein [Pontiella agarivorans]
MIRKFNYTDRIKIKRTDLRVSVTYIGGIPHLDADITIDTYKDDLPHDAAIYVEAYHRTKYNRFSYGTVSNILPPDNRALDAFTPADLQDIRFRVKIVDESAMHGKILALAEGVSAISEEERTANRMSLIGVNEEDLGNRIWELDLEASDMPWLKVNSKIPNVQTLLRSDDMFFCAVYPEIVRQILSYILIYCEEDYTLQDPDPNDETPDWQYRWLLYGKTLCNEKWPRKDLNEELSIEWIEKSVDGFCRNQRIMQRISGLLELD